MDKVLIGIVTYEGKNYCFEKFANFLKSITYPKVEIVFVDNSMTPHNRDKIRAADFNAIWLRKGKNEKEIMANCNEWLREYALQYHFTHLVSLESDIFPYPNFLEIMLSFDKTVIGMPYFIGEQFMSYLLQFEQDASGFHRQLIPMSNAKSFFIANGKLRRSLQIGLGCLMIHRSVLKHIKFQIIGELSDYHVDSSIHMQFQQLGIPVYLCNECYCRHENKSHNRIFTENDVKNSAKYKDFENDRA